ncbi:MAG: lysylphosphatidylglycerol synthase transmembrane domain-containing protein [Candidatus Eisenbacteria bacterium]
MRTRPSPDLSGLGAHYARGLFRRAPLWVAIGALLDLVILEFGRGDIGIGRVFDLSLDAVLLGVVLSLLPWITRTIRVRIWSDAVGARLGPLACLRVVVSSDVLAGVTPTAVGGAPAKAAFLCREGVHPTTALVLTALGSVEDALFFAISVPLAVWLSPSFGFGDLWLHASRTSSGFVSAVRGAVDRAWLALHSEVSSALIALLTALALTLLAGLAGWMIRAVRRRRARPDRGRGGMKVRVRDATALLWRSRRSLLLTLPLTAIQWTARYSIVSCLAFGLGLHVDPFGLYVLQCLVFTAMVFVPTPGATGGAEGAFYLVHEGIAGSETTALLAGWRLLTFLLPVGTGALLLLWMEQRERKHWPRLEHAEPPDEVGRRFGTEVELVVSDRLGVVADPAEPDRIVEGSALLQAGRELRAGEEVVTGRDGDDSRCDDRISRRLCLHEVPRHLELVHLGHEASDAAELLEPGTRVDELRLTVVRVEERQPERDFGTGGVSCGEGEKVEDTDEHQKDHDADVNTNGIAAGVAAATER